ncbi:MAG: NUDIX hydrolase [Treponema sp. CETP13]|nr:MAG: NUDIX hydrolase [Treponema sp. CETP13]
MNNLPFCPKCGRKSLQYLNNQYWKCSQCGLKLYNNIAAATGIIIPIENKTSSKDSVDGKSYNVLFVKRGRNPRKGYYALPGGFVDPDESAENACIRECEEETGYTPEDIHFVCTAPNIYEYADITYKTCDIFFKTTSIDNTSNSVLSTLTHTEEDEITAYKTFPCNNLQELNAIPLAFSSATVALSTWLKGRKDSF